MPEPAVAGGEDPRRYARLMSAVYDATMAGDRPPARPRSIISDSWQRMKARGVDPDSRTPPVVDAGAIDALRRASGLMPVLEEVSGGLEPLVADGENILVVADAQGRVLWRSGTRAMLISADLLGFVEGAHWSEDAVGTNGIGTALASHRAVQVFCAEHFLRSHHPWTCAGAPIRQPGTGQMIGAIDVTGPGASVHPATVALIAAVARLAESHLREQHERTLNRLRAVAAPILARIGAPALAVDADGWVAAVDSLPPRDRIALPEALAPGRGWVPALGFCDIELLPGGWLIRLAEDEPVPTVAQVTLDLRSSAPALEMVGQFGSWRHNISLRHAEILLILALHPDGRTAPQLAADLYGDSTRLVTVRAEMSRLRKQFASIIAGRPYRFADGTAVSVRYPDTMAELLAPSTAPAVRRARAVP